MTWSPWSQTNPWRKPFTVYANVKCHMFFQWLTWVVPANSSRITSVIFTDVIFKVCSYLVLSAVYSQPILFLFYKSWELSGTPLPLASFLLFLRYFCHVLFYFQSACWFFSEGSLNVHARFRNLIKPGEDRWHCEYYSYSEYLTGL